MPASGTPVRHGDATLYAIRAEPHPKAETGREAKRMAPFRKRDQARLDRAARQIVQGERLVARIAADPRRLSRPQGADLFRRACETPQKPAALPERVRPD